MRVALITVVHGRHGHLERQLEMLARSRRPVDAHVVVAMADPDLAARLRVRDDLRPHLLVIEQPAGEYGLPLAAARNAGARTAARRAELLIFLDVDCLPAPGLVDAYCDAATEAVAAQSLLCGPVAYLPRPGAAGYDLDGLDAYVPHPARPAPPPGTLHRDDDHRLFWSLSFAITTPDWDRVGGFCERYEGYGAEDTDLAFTARAAGVGLTWVGGARAHHQWHQTQTPPVGHLDDILRNAAIFHGRWGRWPMEGWLADFVDMGLIRLDETADRYVRIEPAGARETSPA